MDVLVSNSLPHSLVRSKELKQFVASLRPGYKLPETRSITKIIHSKRANILLSLKAYVKDCCLVGTLSADGWTSYSRSYFSLLLHFVDMQTLLPVTILLGVVNKSKQDAQSLLEETVHILAEWGLEDQLDLPWKDRFHSFVT